MSERDWQVERRFGLSIGREGLSFFHRKTGYGTPQSAPAGRGSLAMWALPMFATAGVAMAVPTVQQQRIAVGQQVSLSLDAAQPSTHLAPIAPLTRAELPGPVVEQSVAAAPRAPRLAVPHSFFEDIAPQQAGLSQRAALASAYSTGEATDWVDAKTGDGGLVVVGDRDERGCRDVVVMTRRADGRNDNAARRECGPTG